MEEIENIIIELFQIKRDKRYVILSQQYEKAAQLRDSEKMLEDKLYEKIFGLSNALPGYWNTFGKSRKIFSRKI